MEEVGSFHRWARVRAAGEDFFPESANGGVSFLACQGRG